MLGTISLKLGLRSAGTPITSRLTCVQLQAHGFSTVRLPQHFLTKHPFKGRSTRSRPLCVPLTHPNLPLNTTCRPNSTKATSTPPSTTSRPQSRLSPFSLFSSSNSGSSNSPSNLSSFRKIISLARPERKPLLIATGLLLVSSSISMSIPFTVGRLIDFFSTSNPVSVNEYHMLPFI